MSFAPWIKIDTTTPDKPEVVAIAARLGVKDHDLVTGKLLRLWAWADANSVDGCDMRITRAFIDRLTGLKGFAAAMAAEGWLLGSDGALTFPNFERHNGDSAKRRAMETRKKQNQRKGGVKGGTNVPMASGQNGGPEEEIDYGERERARGAGNFLPGDTIDHRALIRSMRTEWGASPGFSAEEEGYFRDNHAAIVALEPRLWDVMRRFLAARLPEGNPAWQPTQRRIYIRTITEVAAAAEHWERKQTARQSKPLAAIPEPDGPPVIEDPEEALRILRGGDPSNSAGETAA